MALRNLKLFFWCFGWISVKVLCQSHTKGVSESALLKRSLSYTCVDQPVGQVLRQLSDSFDVKFTYINNEIPVSELRSIHCKPCFLGEILDQLFPKGDIAYIPILSQILLKAQKRDSASASSPSVVPMSHADSSLADSVQVVVIKRGVVTKRWKKVSDASLRGKLDLDRLGAFYDYETIYSFVYDTLVASSDSLKPLKKTYTSTTQSFVSKRDPSSLLNGNYLSLGFGLGYAYRILQGVSIGAEGAGASGQLRAFNVKQRRDSLESARMNYFAALMYQYGLGKHFFAKLGIAYTTYGEHGSYDASLIGMSRPRRAGPPSEPPRRVLINDTTLKYHNEYRYLGIPLGIGLTYGKKMGFTVAPMVLLNFLVDKAISYPQDTYVAMKSRHEFSPDSTYEFSQENAYYYKSYLDGRRKEYRTFQISLQLDIEFFYRLAGRYRVFLAPTFSYGLTSIYKSSQKLSQRPYSYGLKLGFAYLLNPGKTRKYISLAR